MRVFKQVQMVVNVDETMADYWQITENCQQTQESKNSPALLGLSVHGARVPGCGAEASWRFKSSIWRSRFSGAGETVFACSKYWIARARFRSFSSSRARLTVIFSRPNLSGFLPAVFCSFHRLRASCQILRA